MKIQHRLTQYPPLYAATLLLFFVGGFTSVLNGLLAPEFKRYFHLNYAQAMLAQFSFFLAYAVLSVPMARLLNRRGWQPSLLYGLFAILLSALLFIPASVYAVYGLFLLGLFGMAVGVVMLEVAGNPLVTWLGAAETASARLNLAQSFNPLAATLAPLVLGGLIFHGRFTVLALIIAAVLLPVILVFWRLPLNVIALPEDVETKLERNLYPVVAFGVFALFLYVGAEIAAGSLLINYLHDVNGLAYRHAVPFLSLYWGGLLAGRLIGAYVMMRVSPAHCLFVVALVCIVLLAAVWASPRIALYGLPALGWFNAIMFPTIIALTLGRITTGRVRNKATGFLLMGIAGGAIIPELQGLLADHVGLRHSFLLLPFCYLVIAAFAIYVARMR